MMFGGLNQDWRDNPDRVILGFMGKANASDYLDAATKNEARQAAENEQNNAK